MLLKLHNAFPGRGNRQQGDDGDTGTRGPSFTLVVADYGPDFNPLSFGHTASRSRRRSEEGFQVALDDLGIFKSDDLLAEYPLAII